MSKSHEKVFITPFGAALKMGTPGALMIIFNIWYSTRYSIDHQGETPSWMGVAPLVILGLSIFFAIQDHRKKFENGLILFKEAVGVGLVTSFYMSFVVSLFLFLFNYFDLTVFVGIGIKRENLVLLPSH